MLGDDEQRHDNTGRGYLINEDRRGLPVQGASNPYYDRGWAGAEVGDQGFSLTQIWRVLLKHRWLITGAFIVSVALGIALTMMMTPVYRAEATIEIDREADKVVKNDQTNSASEDMMAGEEFFQTQYGLLKSRSLAIRVVDSMGLSTPKMLGLLGVKLPAGQADDPAKRRRLAIKAFSDQLEVNPSRGSKLVGLGFNSLDPKVSAQIANATAQQFISSNLERNFDRSSYARDFLVQRLAEAKAKLEDSERAVVAYAESQQIINVPAPGDQAGNQAGGGQSLQTSSLVALNTALAGARGERIRAEARWRQSQQADGVALTEVLQNSMIQDLSQTRAKAQGEYQDKLKIFRPDYPEMLQLQARINELDRQIQAQVKNVQSSLKTQYDIAKAQETDFEGQVNGLKASVLNMRDRSIQYEILQREADTNRQQYDALLQRYKEVGITGAVTTNNISVVDVAEPPTKPARPRPLLNLLLAGLAGLGIGVLLAFLLEILDESVNTPEEVENKLGITLLGTVPKLDKGINAREAMDDPRSPLSEAYYSIRTALQFSTAEGTPSSLTVTSSRPSEGKSTTALAIARGFARLGMRVLLVDGDLRNPSMHRLMQADNSRGFSNYLTGNASINDVKQPTDIPTLSFIPCGPLPPNPAEILAGPRLRLFLDEARGHFDLVLIDGPPTMGLADAPLLAASIAGTLVVIESGGTRRGVAKTMIRRLYTGNAHILGAVLTKFNAKAASYGAGYAYSYDYDYGKRPQIQKS